jgi:DNA mismatch endonuclease (patch repair protein)
MDRVSVEARSQLMARIRSRNTGPELALRRLLHSHGYRFRIHRPDLPGTPDIVFPGRHAVILVHGCFWHRHAKCKLAYTPKSRPEFWAAKFAANIKRDMLVRHQLRAAGWRTLIVWECEMRKNPLQALKRSKRFLDHSD